MRGISSLRPGHALTGSADTEVSRRFWDLGTAAEEEEAAGLPDEAGLLVHRVSREPSPWRARGRPDRPGRATEDLHRVLRRPRSGRAPSRRGGGGRHRGRSALRAPARRRAGDGDSPARLAPGGAVPVDQHVCPVVRDAARVAVSRSSWMVRGQTRCWPDTPSRWRRTLASLRGGGGSRPCTGRRGPTRGGRAAGLGRALAMTAPVGLRSAFGGLRGNPWPTWLARDSVREHANTDRSLRQHPDLRSP